MREYLFRGFYECWGGQHKAFYNGAWHTGEWVYGNYCKAELLDRSGYEDLIIEVEADGYSRRIDLLTVGQFTGIVDKNKKKIFEGDILKWDEKEWGCPHNEICVFDYSLLNARQYDWKNWCEVVGNIYSTPELVKEC